MIRATFIPLLAARKSRLLATAALAMATVLFGLALLGTAGWFLTAAALTTAALSFNLFGPSALVRAFSFLRIASRYGERLVGHDATLRSLTDLRVLVFRRLVAAPSASLPPQRLGDLVARFTGDVEALDALILATLVPLATACATLLAVVAVLAWLLPGAIPVFVAGFVVASLLIPAVLARLNAGTGEAAVVASAALRTSALDAIEGHLDLVAFGATGRATARFGAEAGTLASIGRRRGLIGALCGGASQFVCGLTLLGVAWIGIARLGAGEISGPALVGVVLAVLASFEAVGPMMRGASRLDIVKAAARRVAGVAHESVAATPAALREEPKDGSLSFDKIVARRRPERAILARADLMVGAGEHVAIIGDSGIGKSTALDLIVRLATPESGTIRVGDVDVANIAPDDLYRHVTLMRQDTPVFLGTIRDNLAMGCPDASDDRMREALSAARLHDFVAALPDGLDTWLGESGRTMSAGQARRLCLARALLSPAKILLLDEPTSGLDRETELAFLTDLRAATGARTLVLVTHAALPDGVVDRVLRLADGRFETI